MCIFDICKSMKAVDVRVPGIMCAGNLKDKILWYPYPLGVIRNFFDWAFMLDNESSRHVRKFGLVLYNALEASKEGYAL